jgi:hypothetical protein
VEQNRAIGSEHITKKYNYFSTTIHSRQDDTQAAVNNKKSYTPFFIHPSINANKITKANANAFTYERDAISHFKYLSYRIITAKI